MVGVGVGVEGGHQVDPQLLKQRQVALVPLEHRIDQHPFAAGHIGEQMGEGAGVGIEQLAPQQRLATGGGREQGGGGSNDQERMPQVCL